MVRTPTHRAPTHPGEMLLEEFLKPMNLTQRELATAIHVPYQRVNDLVNERRGITPSTALRLARFFGMSADFWMNLQLSWDLYWTEQAESADISKIRQRKKRVCQCPGSAFKAVASACWRSPRIRAREAFLDCTAD